MTNGLYASVEAFSVRLACTRHTGKSVAEQLSRVNAAATRYVKTIQVSPAKHNVGDGRAVGLLQDAAQPPCRVKHLNPFPGSGIQPPGRVKGHSANLARLIMAST